MIPLAIGLGILGCWAMRRARHCHLGDHGWHGPWHSPYAGHGCHGHRRRGRFGRRHWMLHVALGRLDATPAQERAIVGELDRLHERVHAAKAGLADARGDLAAALRGPSLDDAALGAVLGRVDTVTGEMRAAGLEALRNVHALLDDTQRGRLAELLDGGAGGAGWWRSGPYR